MPFNFDFVAIFKEYWLKALGAIVAMIPLKKIVEWWWTNQSAEKLRVRVRELEAKEADIKLRETAAEEIKRLESLPKTYKQQFCPICKKQGRKYRGIPYGRPEILNGCYFNCEDCSQSWPVIF